MIYRLLLIQIIFSIPSSVYFIILLFTGSIRANVIVFYYVEMIILLLSYATILLCVITIYVLIVLKKMTYENTLILIILLYFSLFSINDYKFYLFL